VSDAAKNLSLSKPRKGGISELLNTHTLSLLLIVAFALIFWWTRVEHTQAEKAIPAGSNMDMYAYHLPAHEYGFSHLKAGTVPLWNPYTNCGMPFLAIYQPDAMFYSLNFLHWFLSPEFAFSLTYLMHYILSGLFMFLWMRRLGCGDVAAAFAGTAYMLCTFVCYPLTWPHHILCYTWIPIIFFFIHRTFYNPQWTNAALLGISAGCQFLAGYVDGHIYTLYGAFLYLPFLAAVRKANDNTERPPLARSIILSLTGLTVIPVLLTAFQWIPTLQLSMLSARPPGGLTKEAVLFGTSLHPLIFFKALTDPDSFLWSQYTLYSGILTLVMAVFAFFQRERWRELIFFSILAVISTLVAFGSHTFFFDLYLRFPTGNWFRLPHRLLILTAFSIATLAGIGCNHLIRNTLPKPLSQSRVRLGIFLGICAIFLLLLPLKAALYVFVLLILCLIGAWARSGAFVGLIALVLVGTDLTLHISDPATYPWIHPEVFPALTKEKEFLREHIGLDRVHIFRRKYSWKNFMLNPNFGMIERLRETSGYESLSLQRYAEFCAYAETGGEPSYTIPFVGWRHWSANNAHPAMINVLGARYIIDDVGRDLYPEELPPKELPATLDLQQVFSDELTIYENPEALPRAFFTQDVEIIAEKRKVLARLADPSFDYKNALILEEAPAPLPARTGESPDEKTPAVLVEPQDEEHIKITIDTPEAGFVFLNDIFFPGWDAYIDETRLKIYRANYLFMAVPVGVGKHTIEFRYMPPGFHAGIWISGVSLLVLLLTLGFDLARGRTRRMAPWIREETFGT
jgi:hypothetical protein